MQETFNLKSEVIPWRTTSNCICSAPDRVYSDLLGAQDLFYIKPNPSRDEEDGKPRVLKKIAGLHRNRVAKLSLKSGSLAFLVQMGGHSRHQKSQAMSNSKRDLMREFYRRDAARGTLSEHN